MKEKTISTKRIFNGKLISLDVVRVAIGKKKVSNREIVRHPGAVAILAKNKKGNFIFVKQYRKAVERELIEVVAGTLKAGENPAACARRELKEETGLRTGSMKKMGVIFLAPGYSSEKLHVFFAETGHMENASPDEDENIFVVELSEKEVNKAIKRKIICDAKTLAAWQMYLSQNL